MKLKDLKCIDSNVDLDDYLELYAYVRNNMEHPEWLGTFTKEEIEDILPTGGKIFLYYDNEIKVCSMFYMPVGTKTLIKHNIDYPGELTGSIGPVMVSPDYIGQGLMNQMIKEIEEYAISIGKEYMYTKAQSDNIYSINNIIKNGYTVTHKYQSDRGESTTFVKKLTKKEK